ncbi:MAG TPA: type II toxin-antitoxin system RelE/ParE family toxin [bacterium]|nr:type II toxin-antitoxin system RelE/ParE family toxin [bacterium]
MESLPAWSTVFYVAPSGRAPVGEWLDGQDEEVQERAVALLQLLRDQGGRLGMPHAKHLRKKVWELRFQARSGAYRLLYAAVSGQRILVLHGFRKTTQETPRGELRIVEERLAEFVRSDRTDKGR